ncbi:MAG: ATP-binding cassette domain-containing protein [Lachnospiraceae bacterium]|nr:ATP-binding cassette domain-containing protein [Lachnospiraceae bacterium]
MALQVQIKKNFGEFALNVDFETEGGCMGILGASGCGKSMTLKCIAGIEKPDEGRIVLNGRVLFDSSQKINLPVQQRRVGYLFQNYALFPTMTVEENLVIAMKGKKKDNLPKIEEQVQRFQLKGLEKHYPDQLSGGQQQRVALARMLLQQPEIIMLDEPFSALDEFLKATLQMEMLELIKGCQRDVLLVSHSRDEIFKFCDEMTIISDGKSILKGKKEDVFSNPRKMEAARLTGCKNISPIEKVGEYELLAKDWGIRLKTDEKISEDIRYVGIRGHRMYPAENENQENTMRTKAAGYAETPFENHYLFFNADYDKSEKLWWIQNKENFSAGGIEKMPAYMVFPKESLMLLT